MRYLSWMAGVLLVLGLSSNGFALTISPMTTADDLANAIVGTGVTISNVNYTGATVASGLFSGGTAAGIGIQNGIVLTSGFASNLEGTSNTADNITGSNGEPGYAPLDALIPGFTTRDATILSFDFSSASNAAFFNYVFGSEEYNEYVDSSFNDVFGFFFNDTNIALIPGTSTPVSINNINNDLNSTYYNDNDPSDLSPVPYAFEYDGFTDVFTASITGLNPGETYQISLAIADAGDSILDSGVFIQGGSFSDQQTDPNTPIPEPGTFILLGAGLAGVAILRRKKS